MSAIFPDQDRGRRRDGPTPPLPLLHALLRSLHIPILPPTLSSTSPSLVLLVLETLLSERLPLPAAIRLCSTPTDEIVVIKCVLGVLAHDVLGMDLTIIDPVRVVKGGKRELEVMIMALAVVAKRRGVRLRVPSPEETRDVGVLEREDGSDSEGELPPPIQPDVSFSSSGPLSPTATQDVFGTTLVRAKPSSSLIFEREYWDQEDTGSIRHESPTRGDRAQQYQSLNHPSGRLVAMDPCLDLIMHIAKRDSVPSSSLQSRSVNQGSQRSQTVLNYMLEEFGLGLES